MAVDRDGLSPSLCRSAEPSILLCVLRRPCRSCSLAPSPPGAATFLSVPRRPPSVVPPSSVGARAFFHSIDLPSAVSLSFHACAALPFRSNDRARGRERGPCRRCSPSSSLNTAAILLPDQVRSRCSLVCSLGWMERREEGTWNKWSPLDPFSCSSSCSAHQLRLCHCHARWRVVPHPASTVRGSLRLEGLRGPSKNGSTRN